MSSPGKSLTQDLVTERHDRSERPINMIAGTIGHFVEWYDRPPGHFRRQ
ncbi:hypothetical protein [Rathayibacter soli]|nr:hypothetical protein [Glaciibacter superstes]